MSNDNSAKAVIEHTGDGPDIVIRVPVANLDMAVRIGCAMGYITGNYTVTKPEEFARDLVGELNDEDDEGTTMIHRMLDKAFVQTIERGGFGVEEVRCPTCENSGWVMNSQQPPPQFDECPDCYNPLGLECP